MTEETTKSLSAVEKLDEIIVLLKEGPLGKVISNNEDEFPTEHDKEFIKNSVELVLTKLCPNYPVKERSGYFELGIFFVLIELQNSKNQLIVGMKTEHNIKRELMELHFIFTETGAFEITDYPEHTINNLVFKFFIELRKEIDRRRILKARSSKFQRFVRKWMEKLRVKDAYDLG